MSDDIRTFCQLETAYLRKFCLNCLDANVPKQKLQVTVVVPSVNLTAIV